MNKKLQKLLELGEDLTILYVEDSEIVRVSTCDILEEYFINVDIAVNGEDGLQKYKTFYDVKNRFYDVVITDINMPKMNGIEMIESIFELNNNANVIVMSAHNEPEHLLQLINMGIANFILKPIEISKFQTVLSRTISNVVNEKKLKHYHTQMEEINLELRKSTEIAQHASEQKSLFLANMSHEIRTPLNAITGFISLLNKEETDPQKLKYLQVVKNASDSLLQIISDILDISKIENGMMAIERVNFNPYEDLITVAELFQAKAAEKGVVLKIQYNNVMPKALYSDLLKIRQICSNLLSNAIKFTPEGSRVKCIVWYAKGKLNIRVKDYGIGIAEDKQDAVFTSFYQVEGTTKKYGGTGLGLAISQELATMLGGEIKFQSVEGKGSAFTLSIEMPRGEDLKEKSALPNVENNRLEGHILLVEDYEANRMFVGIILDNAGLTYEMAQNGVEAIEKFKSGKYDLILMDENMPELGGVGAAKAIIQIEKEREQVHTPIISLTANALKGDRERFLQAGMDDYISKPVEPDKLLTVIKTFLAAEH